MLFHSVVGASLKLKAGSSDEWGRGSLVSALGFPLPRSGNHFRSASGGGAHRVASLTRCDGRTRKVCQHSSLFHSPRYSFVLVLDHFHCPRHNHRKLCISLTSQLVRSHAMRHAPFTGALTSSTVATTTRSTFPFTFRKYPTSGERTANRCCSTSLENSAKSSRFANNRP